MDRLIEVGCYSSFGSVFSVRSAEPLATEFRGAFADMAAHGATTASHELVVEVDCGRWTVSWDGEFGYQGDDIDLALYDSLISINVHAAQVAVRAGAAVLHGGSVEVDGRGVVLVGHSNAGKSTLTAALANSGRPYLADEVVAVHVGAEGLHTVEPFPRPIGLRRAGAASIGIDVPSGPHRVVFPYPVGSVGVVGSSCPVSLILLLKRTTGASTSIGFVSPARALQELTNHTLGSSNVERQMFGRLERMVRCVPCAELRYSDALDVHPILEETMASLRIREVPVLWA